MMNLASWPSQIIKSTQIGKITVEQIVTALGLETDHLTEALEEVYPTPSQEDLECQVVEPQRLVAQDDPDNYHVDLESSSSFSKHFNEVYVLELGRRMGTTFPVMADPNIKIKALYDTGSARSCMYYKTFFSLGLDLDDKAVPHLQTASGTDMGAVGFTTLSFSNTLLFSNSLSANNRQDPSY